MSSSAAYSNAKIFHHPEKLKALIDGERTAPIYIRIKPTNVCNMKCFYCSYSDIDVATNKEANFNDFIEWDVMERFLNDISDLGVKAVTYSGGGDPLCYKYIKEALSLTLEKSIDLSMITNGLTMNEGVRQYLKDAKWVRISLDAANGESYSKIRNTPLDSFDKIFNNIAELRKLTADTEIGINYVIHHMNYDQIYDIAKKSSEAGCNHIKFAARILTHGLEEYHKDYYDIAVEQLKRATTDFADNSFQIVNKYEADFEFDKHNRRLYNNCPMKEITCIIGADSNVYYCHDKAYKLDSVIGSIKDVSFKELWFSKKVTEMFKNFDAAKKCNGHCVYDERNILLNSIIDMDKKHINFI